MKNQLNLLWVLLFTILVFNSCKKDEDSNSILGRWILDKYNDENVNFNAYINFTDTKIYSYYEDYGCYKIEENSYTIKGEELCIEYSTIKQCGEFEVKNGNLYIYGNNFTEIFVRTTVDLDELEDCSNSK